MKYINFLLAILIISVIVGCQTNVKETDENQSQNNSDWRSREIVYKIPEMESIIIEEDIGYKIHGDSSLILDLYLPAKTDKQKLPAVVLVPGFHTKRIDLTNTGQYTSWSKLIAGSGLIAVTYETVEPTLDINDLINFLRDKSDSLNIDKDQINLWSCSGNVPTALTYILNNKFDYLKCGVLYYGLMFSEGFEHLPYWDSVALSMDLMSPRVNWNYEINSKTPLLVVRAGLENTPFLNQAIDEFLLKANENNLPVTFINYPEGQHGFDIYDDNDKSREIIKYTITYFKNHIENKK